MAESDLSNEVNATTVLPATSGVSATTSDGDVDVSWSNNDDTSDGGIDVERSTDGFSTVTTVASGLSSSRTSYTDTSVSSGETYEYRVERNTDHATATSGLSDSITVPNNFLRAISSYSSQKATSSVRNVSLLEDISSYSRSGASSSIRVVDILERVNSSLHPISGGSARLLSKVRTNNSYSNNIASNTSALIDMLAASKSELTTSDSTSDRSSLFYAGRRGGSHLPGIRTDSIGLIDLLESVESYSRSASSFVYNDRTSLELIDHRIDWDDDKAVWYTNWFPESRILDSEDQLSIRSRVIEESKEPAARVCVQYSRDGSSVDQESEVIELGREEEVKEIIGIPIDENGFYRIKIMEYSGYNSIYTLDTAITH